MTARSGAHLGAENVARLEAYLLGLASSGEPLPLRHGKPNLSAVAIACGFDRQVLYKNPGAVALLASFLRDNPSQAADADDRREAEEDRTAAQDRRDRRIHQLEQQLAAVRAENVELRERLRRMRHLEDHMVETGRRIPSFGKSLGEIGKP